MTKGGYFLLWSTNEKLLADFKKLITFGWRHPNFPQQAIKKEFEEHKDLGIHWLINTFIVACFLATMFLESKPDVTSKPSVAMQFILSRCFLGHHKHQSLKLRTCGPSALMAANILHILRAGVVAIFASFTATLEYRHHDKAEKYLKDAQVASFTHKVSPFIADCKMMALKKPPLLLSYLDPRTGDVTIGSIFSQNVFGILLSQKSMEMQS